MANSADDPLATQPSPSSPAQHPPPGAETVPNATPDAAQATAAFEPRAGAASGDATLPTIAGYEILGVLGRGGMGVVYKARHLALKRTVALKMVLSGVHASGRERNRFRIEAEAVARLQHPNIVQIHEIGEADGHPYCALEYIDGGNLADRLDGKAMPPAEAARLVEALARAMQLAHSRNVVHRDLKPANILLAVGSGQQAAGSGTGAALLPAARCPLPAVPKVTDFGLARQLDEDSAQTQAGMVMGTPSYMAPEQAAGEAHLAGPAADIYALGAILYACLTGRAPFRGATVGDTLEQVRTQEPEPPRRHAPNVPRDLETISLKCLRKQPERRYASAEALAEDLRRWSAGEPIEARPVGNAERLALWVRRKPARAGLVLALALLVVAVVTFSTLLAIREHDAAESLIEYNQNLLLAQGEREAALKRARQEAARLALDRGLTLCEADDVGRGLTYLARALDGAVRAQDADLESAIRFNLAAWETQLWSLRTYREGPPGAPVLKAALSPRGSPLAVALADKSVELWDLRDGHDDRTLHTLPHGEPVVALAFSGDGSRLLTRADRTVRIWDIATGRLAGPPLVHAGPVMAAALSPDGRHVLTGAMDAVALLWQADTGTCVASLPHKQRVIAVAFSPRGDRALTGDVVGVAQLWTVPGGEAAGSPLVHNRVVQSAVFSPDGGRVLTGTSGGTVHLWQVESAQAVFPPLPVGEWVAEVAFSPDGQRLAARTFAGQAYLWRADTGNVVAAPLPHQGRVESVAFSPDSQTLLTGGAGGTAQGWDATRGRPTGPLLAHLDAVRHCVYRADGRSVITVDGAVRRWQAPPGLRRAPPFAHGNMVRAAAFSPDGQLLLTGGGDSVARLWPTTPGAGPPRLLKHGAVINAVAFTPDGRRALTAAMDAQPVLWDVAGGARRAGLRGHTKAVVALALSGDGVTALTGSMDGTARLWDVATAAPGAVLPHAGSVHAVALSPNARHALTGSTQGSAALLWDLSTRPPAVTSLPHDGAVEALAFSTDGRTAITADLKGGSIRLWETATGTLRQTLSGHALGVKTIAVSPDGRYLVSGSFDRTARLWTLATGEPVGLPLSHHASLRHVTFSPDSRTVWTGSDDNTARRWHVPTGVPIGPAFRHAAKVQAVAVHPDGTMAATASYDHTVALWETPPPRTGSPGQLAQWAERVTGLRLDDSGALRVMTRAAWQDGGGPAR